MNMENWEGAQWVLITLMLCQQLLWIIARASGINTREIFEWISAYMGVCISQAFLFGILYWGGFWA